MSIEILDDDEFHDVFLCMVAESGNPKLVPTFDEHAQGLTAFQIAWSVSVAEEQGFQPLISTPAHGVNYFIFYGLKSGLVGYLGFTPRNH